MVDTDRRTGLPEPLDGGFWRVQEQTKPVYIAEFVGYNRTGQIEVVLMRNRVVMKRKHWWSQNLAVTEAERYPNTIAVATKGRHPIAVKNAAHAVLKAHAEYHARQALLGDYPPKSLSD